MSCASLTTLNLCLNRGATFTPVTFYVFGVDELPYDLTDCTWEARARTRSTSALVVCEFTVTNSDQVTNKGEAIMDLEGDTSELRSGVHDWDAILTLADGTTMSQPIFSGSFSVGRTATNN